MSKDLNILVIVGTTRPQRKSRMVADYLVDFGKKINGVNIKMADPQDMKLPGDGNDPESKDARYTKLTAEADAFFIVVPEYNHSFPGSLKRLLDSEFDNYLHKPVAFAGVSSGVFGGARAIEAILSPVKTMGLTTIRPDVYFQKSYDLFDEEGQMVKSEHERYDKATKKAYDELIWMAKSLKAGRDG